MLVRQQTPTTPTTASTPAPTTAPANANTFVLPYDAYMFVMCRIKQRSRAPGPQRTVTARHVIEDSCVPAFLGADNTPLTLYPSQVTEAEVIAATTNLHTKSFMTQRKQGRMYIGAYAFGSMLSGFHKNINTAFKDITPGGHRFPLIAVGAEVSLAFTPLMTAEDAFFSHVFTMDQHRALYPKDPVTPKVGDLMLSAGAAAAGYASARVLIHVVSAAAGPWGIVAGYIVIPFIASIIVANMSDHDGDALKNFGNILQIEDPSNMSLKNTSQVKSVPEVAEALGKTLLETAWTPHHTLHSYCVPRYGQPPDCREITYDKEFLGKFAPPSLTPTCPMTVDPSPFPQDAPFYVWEGYINCAFTESAITKPEDLKVCSQKYGCEVQPISHQACIEIGQYLQERLQSTGKKELLLPQIQSRCKSWIASLPYQEAQEAPTTWDLRRAARRGGNR